MVGDSGHFFNFVSKADQFQLRVRRAEASGSCPHPSGRLSPAQSPDRKVSRGHVKRSAFMLGEQAFQNIGENVGLIIDDGGKLHLFYGTLTSPYSSKWLSKANAYVVPSLSMTAKLVQSTKLNR
jgi:hypothetical protein